MAKFNVTGLEALEKEITRRTSLLDDAAPDMLKAGTDVLADYMRGSIIEKDLVDSGDLLDSIRAGKLHVGTDGYYQEVYPHGRDHKGVSNALKGAILEYGTSTSDARKKRRAKKQGTSTERLGGIEATHWVSEAAEAAGPEVVEAMRKVWNEYMERTD